MQSTASVTIDREIDDVFQLTQNVAQWSNIVVEDEVVEDKNDGGVGTRFRTVTEDHGRRMDFDGEITCHEPPHRHAIKMTGNSFDIEAEYTFDDLAGQTRVTQTSSVKGRGVFGVFLLLFGWLMTKGSCDALQKELDSLKAYCENR